MKKIWETGIILFATMGFWGMIYPDLCFTEEVCEVSYEQDDNGANETSDNGDGGTKDLFTQICEAKPEQIRIRSALLHHLLREHPEEEKKEVFHKEDMLVPIEITRKEGIMESKGKGNEGDKRNREIQ